MSFEELKEKTIALVEETDKHNPVKEGWSQKAVEILEDIAEKAVETDLYKNNEERRVEFEKECEPHSSKTVYQYMLNRIIEAPIELLMYMSVLLLAPTIVRKIREEQAE